MSEKETTTQLIGRNWNAVLGDVRNAAITAGRVPSDITVIGVSKYVDVATTQSLVDAGCGHLGESRPQVLWQKAEQLVVPNSLRWHMIGHLQTNKLRRTLRFDPLIHSVDSERLLRAIDREACHQGRLIDVLLEVNISGDETKTGLSPESLRDLVQLDGLSGLRIVGLMAMAGWGTKADVAETQFREVAKLRDDLAESTGNPLQELSMGMSGDFRQAIIAGATMVRIGSALFEGIR